jgi:predicted AlkP superfamily phosphohydrolase/phosphomutase
LIGLDGATFTILDPLMGSGAMPFLRRFMASGVRANLRTIVPALTPPAWTSLMTGRTPGHHGIFDFFQPETADNPYLRFASSSDVAAETIWSMASRQGLKVTALNFPLMFPPKPVNGFVVPGGWMPWKQLRLACYPSDLYDRLKALPGFNARELAMDMSVEEKAIEGCRDDEYEEWIQFHIRREQHWFQILEYLMREEPCDLTAVMFDGVDKLQHLCWIYLDPAYGDAVGDAAAQRVRDLCIGYFRELDGILERIVELAGPRANVVMASDHGFGPTVEVFNVNTWLEQNGYLAWAEGGVDETRGATLGMADLTRHIHRLDWSRTTAYAATPSSNGIHIVRAGQELPGGGTATGVAPEDYERFRAELAAKLRAYVDPATGSPVVTGAWTREEVFPGPRAEIGPDLTLELRDGGLVSILPAPDGVPLHPRPKAGGAHRPEGIFIAAGPMIRAGVQAAELSILDVAPTLLYSLGLPAPGDLEGHLPEEIVAPEVLRERPVQSAAAAPVQPEPEAVAAGVAESVETLFDAEAEATVLARLRALGYVE